jgi:uncharacterized protein
MGGCILTIAALPCLTRQCSGIVAGSFGFVDDSIFIYDARYISFIDSLLRYIAMDSSPSLRDRTQSYIGDIRSIDGVTACALVTVDGCIMGHHFPREGSAPQLFAAMSATILASAETAAGVIGIRDPASITVSAEDATIIVIKAGHRALITAVVDMSADIPSVHGRLVEIATRIGVEV